MDEKTLTFYLSEEQTEEIDNFWYAKRFTSRAQAIRKLLEIGMNTFENDKNIKE